MRNLAYVSKPSQEDPMKIGMVGINHLFSNLSQREQMTKVFQNHFYKFCPLDFVLLSTCNRVELYFSTSCLMETYIQILKILQNETGKNFDQNPYSYFRIDCFLHLSRVIAGLDSLIFGESDIQRQVKLAYETARKRRKLSASLHYAFQKGFKIAKEMRTNASPPNIQLFLAVRALIDRLELKQKRILIVGNSSVNRALMCELVSKEQCDFHLCTRTGRSPFPKVKLRTWEEKERWSEYDVIIAGTYHEDYVIRPQEVTRSVLLIDLGVPRNIDPELSHEPNAHLYNIDDLSRRVNSLKKMSQKKINSYEVKIKNRVIRQAFLFSQKHKRYTEMKNR